MAHEVESMMFVGHEGTPWHGLGTPVDEALTSSEAIIQAGLDWTVRTSPTFILGPDGNPLEIGDTKAIVRDTDNSILGTVGNRYTPVQNIEAFDFLDTVVNDGSVRYHTAGSLFNGKKIWLLAKVGSFDVVPGDKVDQYLFLHNAHDGTGALKVLFTPVRVVCANTARLALASGEGISIRHQGDIKTKIHEAQKVLGLAQKHFSQFQEFTEVAKTVRMDTDRWNNFALTLIPDPPEKNSTKAANQRNTLTNLFTDGTGQNLVGVAGTGWAAFNAVTEFANYQRPAKGSDKERQENRMVSSLFGPSAKMISTAMDSILSLAA